MPNQTEAWAEVFSPCESISVGPWSLSKIIIIIIGLIYLSEERVIKSQNYRWTSDWWMDGNSLRCIVSLVVAFLLIPTGMHVLDRRIAKERGSFDGIVKNLTSEKQANNLELGRVMQSSKLKILAFTQKGVNFFFQVSTVIKKEPEGCGIYIFFLPLLCKARNSVKEKSITACHCGHWVILYFLMLLQTQCSFFSIKILWNFIFTWHSKVFLTRY